MSFLLAHMVVRQVKSEIDTYVINKVREMRLKANYSQADLAFKLDISYAFIGHVESPNFRAKYNLNHINKLAEIFDCSPRDFLPERALK